MAIATEYRPKLDIAPEIAATDSPAGYICLVVSDTGCGMDGTTRERIFEPFFTTKAPGKGTGLGLATVYGIVKQSGGGIHVESELGKGSRFILYFPLETAAVDVAPTQVASSLPSANAETLLVVEDEEVVRQLMCAVLADAGYSVLCAATPEEALRMTREHEGAIDLLVTDVVMPEMPGPALAREVIALRPGVKVLFVSGYSESDITEQGVVETALEVLQKPFTKMALIRRVREMLDGEGKEPLS